MSSSSVAPDEGTSRKVYALKKHNSLARKIAESSRKQPKRLNFVSSRLCGHCNQKLSLKVFKKHEKLYKRPDQSWIISDDLVHQTSRSSSG